MAHTAERVRDEALQLTPEEREVQQAWIDVAEQRYEEWKAGRATMHSTEDVLEGLRAKYGQHVT